VGKKVVAVVVVVQSTLHSLLAVRLVSDWWYSRREELVSFLPWEKLCEAISPGSIE